MRQVRDWVESASSIAGLIALAKSAGARVIEVNVDQTAVSSLVDVSLRGPAAEILPEIAA